MIDVELACQCTRDDIGRLSDAELVALADAVEVEVGGEPIVKASDRELALERSMARGLNDDFVEDLDGFIDSELRALDAVENSADEVQGAVDGVTRRMNDRSTAKATGIIAGTLTAFATIGRRVVRSTLIDRGWLTSRGTRSGGISVAASLNQADEAAIAALSGNQTLWIGDYWNKHLSSRISATVRREALERGLGRAEVGKIMRGVVSNEFPGVSVPGTFRGSSESYFEMLSGTVRNHASTFGALTGLQQAEFERYRIVAVMDERTSEQCRLMHNRTFKVSTGISQMNASFMAEDPEAVKNVAGWKKPEQIIQAAGDGDAKSQERGLAAAGLALPPFHARCRTIVMPE